MPLLSYPLLKMLSWTGWTYKKQSQPKNDAGIKDREKKCEGGEEVNSKGLSQSSARGWSHLRFLGELPTATTLLWQVLVAYLGYDFMFYWSHRFLHQKSVYLQVHKQHHRFRTSIGLASSFQHPLEGAIQMLNWYLPIGFAGWLKGDLHVATLFAYNCFRWIETVDAHSGYSFPWSPFTCIPLFGGAVMHDYHHSGDGLQMVKNADGSLFADFGNYGASVIWDRLMGTASNVIGGD